MKSLFPHLVLLTLAGAVPRTALAQSAPPSAAPAPTPPSTPPSAPTAGTPPTSAPPSDLPPPPASTPPTSAAPANPGVPPEPTGVVAPPAPSTTDFRTERSTPTTTGGPGDPNPAAAGPGGAVVVQSGENTVPNPSDVRAERATPTATGGPGDPASAAAGPGGFRILAHDNRSEIRFRALVQADGRFWFEDNQRPQTDTFLIRRAQTWAEGRLPYGITFMLNPDFGGGTVVLQDAYLGLEVGDFLKFRFGKFRPPFGLERLQPTSNLSFVEFGLPTLLTPNRDVGAMAYGDLLNNIVGYGAGIFNGVADNASADLALDKEKEFDGRVYLRPFRTIPNEALGRLFVGVAGTFGRVYGNPTSPNLPSYKTPGQATIFSYTAAASGNTYANTVVANGPHNRYGAYLYEAIGPVSVSGEYYLSDQEVGLAGKGNSWIHNKAFEAAATVLFFGADASYDFVHVKTPFDPQNHHFGALELAGRIGHLDLDTNAFPNYAATNASVRGATEGALGLNWYLSDNAKLVFDWDHTEFQGGAKTAPELLAQHREAENIWLMRAQVVY
jgi:phosphate-selective porin OprO/OprP